MAWDPFGDNATEGLRRNRFKLTDQDELNTVEFILVKKSMPQAIQIAKRERQIEFRSWLRCHKILFGKIYPWAGTVRHLDVQRGNVLFNLADRLQSEAELVFRSAQDLVRFSRNLGETYGELAFAHPFLDGNGRSLNVIFSEMCRRSGFSIAWDKVNKDEYLEALTDAIRLREYGKLDRFLHDLKVDLENDEAVIERMTTASKRNL